MQSIVPERAHALDPFALSSVQVRHLCRQLRRNGAQPDVRIAFAGNVVFDPLAEFVETHLACHGMTSISHVASFGQPLQELLDPASALRGFDPGFLFLHFELEGLLPGLLERCDEHGEEDRLREVVEEVIGGIEPVVRTALRMTRASVLLTNFPGPERYDLGIADARSPFGQQELFARLNSALAARFRAEPRVQIVDLCRLTAWHGRSRALDRRMYYFAKIPWHESFLPLLADEIVRHVGAALGRVRKCLVVDLDNTLWGGVLGEDGPYGVRVGMGDPVAEAHFDLQRRILALKKRGILLAVCSKNNPADVEEIFRLRTDMPLRREDFACVEVGWDMKHQGLQRIAQALNIGLDSLVFLDDNPAEIELVRQALPEVQCVLVPEDPAQRPGCLDRVHGLERAVITTEDFHKTRQYQDNAARESARRQFTDLHGYLRSLDTRVELRPVCAQLLPRAHQLFTKTNQFNLTTRRYTAAELEAFAADASCRLLMARAQDRFGDLGWIGAILLRGIGEPQVVIDSFVLSCRAMGREIETALLNHVKQVCFGLESCRELLAEYRPTARNLPVKELYERQGFEVIDVLPNGGKRYRLQRQAGRPLPCDWVALEAQWI